MENKEEKPQNNASIQGPGVGEQRNNYGPEKTANYNSSGTKQQNKVNGQSSKSSRQYREIYRPPSLRSKSNRNSNSGNDPSQPSKGINANPNATHCKAAVPSVMSAISPHMGRRPFQYNAPPTTLTPQQLHNHNLSLNANAQEFQVPINQTQSQQIQQNNHNQQIMNNLLQLRQLQQLDPSSKLQFYGDVSVANNLGFYSLQQSKSLGNNLNALSILHQHQQQQQQFRLNSNNNAGQIHSQLQQYNIEPHQLAAYLNIQNSTTGNVPENVGFNRICQSRSSGSIPNTKPRVRFDMDSDEDNDNDKDQTDEATRNMIKNAETQFSHLSFTNNAAKMPQKLQKSRTGYMLNFQQQKNYQSGSYCVKGGNANKNQGQGSGILKPEISPIKRSRSFGTGSSGAKFSVASVKSGSTFSTSGGHSVYSDFIKMAQTHSGSDNNGSVDRVTARQQIEMVNAIFDAMLMKPLGSVYPDENTTNSDKLNDLGKTGEDPLNKQEMETETEFGDLSSAAVHIFLYFIKREKDRTVMESLLNTCFATYQKLFGSNGQNLVLGFDLNPSAPESGIFLRFLSTLYTQVKLLRSQKNGRKSIDEMSFSVLAVLCDSCLAMLRSRLSNDSESMGCLFTVMTSQGRNMEGTFPLKMKQLLAAVRDALLGLGPYSQGPLCPMVQKTLMQLIELHAANWALPASAVRYYYSNSNSSNNSNPSNMNKNNFNANTTI